MLSSKEVDVFSQIISISKAISFTYQRLLLEEVCNDNNTDYYFDLKNELMENIKTEEQLYNELQVNFEKGNELFQFLKCTDSISIESRGNNVIDAIDCVDYNELYYFRIIDRIRNEVNKKISIVEEHFMKEGMSYSLAKDSAKTNYLSYALFTDFEHCFMYFNNKNIEQVDDNKIKDYLTKVKYSLICISRAVEKAFVNNEDLYMQFPFVAELNRYSSQFIEHKQISFYNEGISAAFKNMFMPDDEYLIHPEFYIHRMIFSSYLKGVMAFIFPLTNYEELVNGFKQFIDNINETEGNNLSKSTNFIFEQIDSLVEERPKFKYLHFLPYK